MLFVLFIAFLKRKITSITRKRGVVGQKPRQILAIFLRTSAFYLYIDKQYSVITTPIFCNLNKAKRFFSSCMFFCFSRRYKEMRCYSCFIIYLTEVFYNTIDFSINIVRCVNSLQQQSHLACRFVTKNYNIIFLSCLCRMNMCETDVNTIRYSTTSLEAL